MKSLIMGLFIFVFKKGEVSIIWRFVENILNIMGSLQKTWD